MDTTGTVSLVTKAWGTQVTPDLSKIRGPLECELVAVAKTGERRVVMGWFMPAAGYGVPGHPVTWLSRATSRSRNTTCPGSKWPVVHGRTLLSIRLATWVEPARRRPVTSP